MIELPELLTTEAMRDFIIAAKERDRWVPLGPHYAPGFLMGSYRRVICEVYGVRLPREVPPATDLPRELRHLNDHFFFTDSVGLTDRQALWRSVRMNRCDLPVLWRVSGKQFRDLHEGQTVAGLPLTNWFWNHPHRRRFERVVIVPTGRKES